MRNKKSGGNYANLSNGRGISLTQPAPLRNQPLRSGRCGSLLSVNEIVFECISILFIGRNLRPAWESEPRG